MARVLRLKLFRDLWRQRIQCLAIIMIVACGVASQITSFSLIATLQTAMERYYESSRFPDLFAKVTPLSLSQVGQLRSVSGVSAIQPRLVFDSPLNLPKEPEDGATATLIAVPRDYLAGINRLVIRRGSAMEDLSANQVLVSEVFAEARGLAVGDSLSVNLQGHRTELSVAGIAISPEFLFQIRDGAGVPDNRRYAVLWMRYEDLSRAAGIPGRYNEVLITLQKDASRALVKERIERILGKDQVVQLQDRAQQVSHRYTSNAIAQLYSVAIVPPAIFLAVAAFLIYIATSRLIRLERENIAMQRAFGYSAWDVGLHYFCYVMIVVLLGCVVGIAGGVALASAAIGIYQEIYRFPTLPLCVSPLAVVYSLLASCIAGWVGGGYAVWRVASMPPAVGLRPEPPASYRLTWFDQIANLLRLSPIARMILRGIGRWPLRTALGVLGIALGIGVMILGSYTQGAIGYVIDFEFFLTRRYDLMIQFAPGTQQQSLGEIRRLPGVLTVEGFASAGFKISAGHVDRSVTVLGVERERTLICPVGENLRPVQFYGHGVALSRKLTEALHVGLGSIVELSPLGARDKAVEVRVEAIVADYSGLNAYLDLKDFKRWFRENGSVGGAIVQCDANQLTALIQELNRRPHIQAVTVKQAALENFKTNDSKNLLLFRVFNMLFSCVIGVGAVYSIASISLVERQRDLALLRVLGYSAAETGRVLIGELMVMSAIAIPVGCLSGWGFAYIATWMLNSETQRIPLWIQPASYVSAVLVSILSALISAIIIQRSVNRLDCVTQLKSKD